MKALVTFSIRQRKDLDSIMAPFVAEVTDGSGIHGVGYGRTCEEAEEIAVRNFRREIQLQRLPEQKQIEL